MQLCAANGKDNFKRSRASGVGPDTAVVPLVNRALAWWTLAALWIMHAARQVLRTNVLAFKWNPFY